MPNNSRATSMRTEPSPEALALRASLEAQSATPIEAATITRRRAQVSAAYEPRIRRALDRYRPTIATRVINGVSCLDLTVTGDAESTIEAGGTILYFFGGGHIGGNARQDFPIMGPLAAATGARIIAVDYRLAPEYPYPAAVDDAEAVYRGLLAEGADRLVLAGESSGGNLAMALGLRLAAKDLRMPGGIALLSPWLDLTDDGTATDPEAARDPTLNTAYLEAAAALYAGVKPRETPEISPGHGSFGPGWPPVLITTAGRDRLRGGCECLAASLTAAGGTCQLLVWPGLWHVFEYYDELPEARESLDAIAVFLAARLAEPVRPPADRE